MPTGQCAFAGCENIGTLRKGLCGKHYERLRVHGDPAHVEPFPYPGSPAGRNRAKTHCKHGHEFTPENTYLRPDGRGRHCRDCTRRHAREGMRRKRAPSSG